MTTRPRALAVGAACAALLAAGCGSSPEDTAHDNGKAVGKALRSMADAQNADELQAGAQQLRGAVADVSDDVAAGVRRQVTAQKDHLNKVIGDLRQAATSPDSDTAAQARSELQVDLQAIRSQASSFQGTRNSVTNSFWQGVKDGYDD
jgi:hypothetical protein